GDLSGPRTRAYPAATTSNRKKGRRHMLGRLIPKSWAIDMPRSFFRDVSDLDRDLYALFEGVFRPLGAAESDGAWWPSVEAHTRDGKLVVRCDLPGVDPSDVDVSLDGKTLTISGVRRSEREGKEDGHRFSEVRYGRFERSLTVPAGPAPEKVTARSQTGVLEVSAPRPPGVGARKGPTQLEQHG